MQDNVEWVLPGGDSDFSRYLFGVRALALAAVPKSDCLLIDCH